MVTTLFLVLAGSVAAGGVALVRKIMSHVIADAGELLVTGTGEVIIDEVMPESPELLRHPQRYITVEFDQDAPAPPPCAGGHHGADELRWELIIVRSPRHSGEELRLRIDWNVNNARTIKWSVTPPPNAPHHR